MRSSDRGSGSPSPFLVKDGEVEVGCGGSEGWPPSVMKAGLPGVLTQTQVEGAFTDLLANPKYRAELELSFLEAGPSATSWRVLRVDGDTYTLGLGRWTGSTRGKVRPSSRCEVAQEAGSGVVVATATSRPRLRRERVGAGDRAGEGSRSTINPT
jgi:hypothetical protein